MPSLFQILKTSKLGPQAAPDMLTALIAQKRSGDGKIRTLTGIPPLTFKANGKPLISWSVKGNGQQTGTPSPDNPVMPEFAGVRTTNLWNKGVPIYNYTSDYKKYNSNNAIALKSGTYTISSDGILPQIQAFHADLSPYTDIQDAIQNDAMLYVGWDNRALLPASSAFRRSTIVIKEDCIITMCCNQTYIGTYIMLNTGSTVLPYEPFGYKIPITCAGQTTPVYLGQVQTVRKIRKLVLDGSESWFVNEAVSTEDTVYLYTMAIAQNTYIPEYSICSHFEYKNAFTIRNDNGFHLLSGYGGLRFRIMRTIAGTVADFKSYLAQQYAAGTPVTVWYVLAAPETAIVNEPLAKIGDYADELHITNDYAAIPTIKGQNTLTVDTDLQPSEMTITYKG